MKCRVHKSSVGEQHSGTGDADEFLPLYKRERVKIVSKNGLESLPCKHFHMLSLSTDTLVVSPSKPDSEL